MKRKLTLLMMLLVVLVLSACNFGSETKEFKRTSVPDGEVKDELLEGVSGEVNDELLEGVSTEIVLTYKNDKVISLMKKQKTDYSILGVSNKKGAKAWIKENAESPIDIKGVSTEFNYTENEFIIETNVIVKDLDVEELEEHQGFIINQPVLFGKAQTIDPETGVSLDDALERLNELGYSEE